MPPKRKATDQLLSKKGIAKRSKSSAPRPRKSTAPTTVHKWFNIRDIVDESESKYKVDWEDDLETGEKFPPEWLPRKEVNELAVAAWEERKRQITQVVEKPAASSESSREPDVPIHPRPRSDSPLFVPSRSPSIAPRRTRNRRRVVIESSPPSPESVKVQKPARLNAPRSLRALVSRNPILSRSAAQSSSGSTPEVIHAVADISPKSTRFAKSILPGLAVRVSPRHIPSSQVWDYLSNPSAPYSTARDETTDVGIGESLLSLEPRQGLRAEHDYIVPDSQSLIQSPAYIASNSNGQSGSGGPFDPPQSVPASSLISHSLRVADVGSPVSEFYNPRLPEPVGQSSNSRPSTPDPDHSRKNYNTRAQGELPGKESTRSPDHRSHSTPSQNTAGFLSQLSNSDRAAGEKSRAQTSHGDYQEVEGSGDSSRLSPASINSNPSQSESAARHHQISDQSSERGKPFGRNKITLEPKSPKLRTATNGHPTDGDHNRKQDNGAFRPQPLDSQTLPLHSKPVRSSPTGSSNGFFQTQEPFSRSLSRASALKVQGEQSSSTSRKQVRLNLDESIDFPRPAASSSNSGRSFASSAQARKPVTRIHNSSSASKAYSPAPQFQTRLSLELDSSTTSPRRSKRSSRSKLGSLLASTSTTHARLHPTPKPEELAQSSEETPRLRDSSVLSERDPNSQPESLLHSAQEREEICFPSIELTESELEKSNQTTVPSSLALSIVYERKMAENGQTAVSPVVQMPALHATPTPERSLVPFRERLRNMRADSVAKLRANSIDLSPSPMQPSIDISKPAHASVEEDVLPPRATYRSPSIIPKPAPVEPVGDSRLEIQTIQDPISAGTTQEVPLAPVPASQIEPPAPFSQRDIGQALKAPKVGPMEFVVPLPAPARVRDQYVAIINNYQKVIQAIVQEEATDPLTVEKAREFLDNVENVSIHLDMVDSTTSTQQDVPPQAEAQWASTCSFKFHFLQQLIGFARHDDLHIVIVAKGGRLMDLIETFLKGSSVAYNRPDAMTSMAGFPGDNLYISLITSKQEDSTELLPTANLVIAFDSTFDAADPQVQEIRSHLLNVGQLAPVVHLLIYSSPEHISRCLPSFLTDMERIRVMISCVTFTREEFGSILPDENIPEANAEEVAAFIKAGAGGPWVIPPIRAIETQGLEFEFQDTQASTQVIKEDRPPAKSKRTLEIEEEGRATPKRVRLTPVPDQPDITHVSDSVPGTSALANSQAVQELRTTIDQYKAREKEYKVKEEQHKAREEQSKLRESKLQAALTTSEARVQELSTDLSGLQTRYEKRNVQYHALKHEKNDLVAKSIALTQTHQRAKLDLDASKEKLSTLESDLDNSRAALQNSAIPAVAAIATAESSAQAATILSTSLQKKLDALQSSFDYTRQQYQSASTSAVESAQRIAELEAASAELEKKAAGEAARLREVNGRAELETHRERIRELEATLEDREDLLRRKEGARGRGVTTRAGSVQPRSPRLGAVSRQGSPMPGFLGVGGLGGRGRGRFLG